MKTKKRDFLFYLAPPGFWLFIFFFIPLVLIAVYAFAIKDAYGGIKEGFTFENFSQVFEPLYLGVFVRSLLVSLGVTVTTMLLGYPVAYYLSFTRSRLKYFLLFCITLPLWTNFLVKVYSFIILLGENGLVNNFLIWCGLVDKPLALINNTFSLFLSFVYINLPFLIMPVYASLDKIDHSFIEASQDLGAGRVKTFWKIIVPWSAPGLAAGIVFVFVPTLTNFLVPEFLGGINNYMIGNLITQQFSHARNLPLGADFSSIIVLLVVILTAAYLKYFNPYSQHEDSNER